MSAEKNEKRKAFIPASLESLVGALVGGGSGGSIGYLLNLDTQSLAVLITISTTLGNAVGSGLGGVLGHVFSDKLGLWVNSKILLKEKLNEDLNSGYLENNLTAIKGLNDSGAVINEVRKTIRKNKSTQSNLDKRFEVIEGPNINSHFLTPEMILQNLKRLKKFKTIKVNVSAIGAGAIAVIKSLSEEYSDIKKYGDDGLKIVLDYSPINGREQITLLKNGELFDFIVVPNDPFYYMESQKCENFLLLLCCFRASQFLFWRKGTKFGKSSGIYVFDESSAKLHWDRKKNNGFPSNAKPIIIEESEKIITLKENIDNGDGTLIWSPLSKIFEKSSNWVKDDKITHNIFWCLRCHKKWDKNKDRKLARKAFESLFVNEWKYCSRNRSRAWELLKNDYGYIKTFEKGAGL